MAAAAPLATQISRNCSSILSLQQNSVFAAKTTSSKRLSVVRVRASSKPERDQTADEEATFVSQEDVKYLVQLGAGSVAGAAAIKYGTILFPEIKCLVYDFCSSSSCCLASLQTKSSRRLRFQTSISSM